jgi:hypothetical protein
MDWIWIGSIPAAVLALAQSIERISHSYLRYKLFKEEKVDLFY